MENGILDSWKEIAAYLGRDVRTCINWENEHGFPVHRINPNSKRSKVFAYRSEIDAWLRTRSAIDIGERGRRERTEKRRRLAFETLAIVFFVAIVILMIRLIGWPGRSRPGRESLLAIMPFEAMDGASPDTGFSRDMATGIADRLSLAGGIRIIPPLLTAEGPVAASHAPTVGKSRTPDYFLKGIATEKGGRFRLAVELLKGAKRRRVWHAEYSDDVKNLLFVQASVSGSLSALMGTEPGREPAPPDERPAGPPGPAAASSGADPWPAYYQADYYIHQYTRQANKTAEDIFSRLIEEHGDFAQAYIGLAECYNSSVSMLWDPDPAWLDRADELLEAAQKISPGLAEYYAGKVDVLLIRHSQFGQNTAQAAFDMAGKGIARYPDHAWLNSKLGFCFFMKFGHYGNEADLRKAIDYKARSFWFHPASIDNITYVDMLIIDRQFARAGEICGMMEKNGSTWYARYMLGRAYYFSGDRDRSLAIFEELEKKGIEFVKATLLYQGMIWSGRGDRAKALGFLDRARTKYATGRVRDEDLKIASIYAGLGMREECLAALKRLFESKSGTANRFALKRLIALDGNFKNIDPGQLNF